MPVDPSQFEKYLKQFRPVPAKPLVIAQPAVAVRRFRFWWPWAFAAAAMVMAVLLLVRLQSGRSVEDQSVSRNQQHYTFPLNLGRAKAQLFVFPSIKQALVDMA